jgi:hypothetical protein
MKPSDISSARSILRGLHYTANTLDNPPNHPMRGHHICGSTNGFAPEHCLYCWRALKDAVLRKIKATLHKRRFIRACKDVVRACPEAGNRKQEGEG